MPMHTGKGRSVAEALRRTTNYVENPDKTDGGEWITANECDPAIADQEFLFSKRQYAALLAEKKNYPGLKQAWAKMIELMTAKNNVERILGMSEQDRNRVRQREEGR